MSALVPARPLRRWKFWPMAGRHAVQCTFLAASIPLAAAENERGLSLFTETVQPALARHCYACHSHGADAAKGGVILDSKAGWTAGSSHGPILVPGQPGE